MTRFLTLISIESTKLWKRISSIIMLLIIVFIVIAATSMVRFVQYRDGVDVHAAPTVSESWKSDLSKEVEQQKAMLAQIEQGKDNRIERTQVGSLKMSIAEGQYRIDHDISSATPLSIWSRMISFNSQVGIASLIALLLMIACVASVAGEFSEGTVKMAISRPYKRYEILSAKLIASLLYGLTLLAVSALTNFIMYAIFYGVQGAGLKALFWTGENVLYIPAVLKLLALYGLDFLTIIFYVLLAFALSTITRSRSISTGFALFMLLVGGQIAMLVGIYFEWGKYVPFALTNFSSFVLDGSRIPNTGLPMALVISGIYALIMGVAGYMAFSKRDI